MNKRITIILIVLAIIIVVLPIEHNYGDNIYGYFAFRNEDVMKISDSKYRTHKDNPEYFYKYMERQGWSLTDELGSCKIFEKDGKRANCILHFKEFYAEYDVTYEIINNE